MHLAGVSKLYNRNKIEGCTMIYFILEEEFYDFP